MRRLAAVLPLCLVLAATARAEDAALTPAAQAFVKQLESDSWGGSASAGGLKVRARQAAICSQGMLDLLANPGAMPEGAKEAMKSLAEFELKEDGYFMKGPIGKGKYALGIERGPKNLRLVLRDEAGAVVMIDGMWIAVPSEENAQASVSSKGGAVTADVACGGIHLAWRYVTEKAHREALGDGLKAYTEGVVTITSDLERPEDLKAMAAECSAAVASHAALIGRDAPEGGFHIYLFKKVDAYRRIDTLLTDGAFQLNGAFSADLTRRAYIWYWLPTAPEFFADHGIPLKIRALLLHELFHMVAGRARPEAPNWPRWLGEGLAELASEKALPEADARAFRELCLGQWRAADEVETTLTTADLMAGAQGTRLTPFYTAAYFFIRELHERPDDLRALLDALADGELPFEAAGYAREALEKAFGPAHATWSQVREGAARDSKGLRAVINGVVDDANGGLRVASTVDGDARVLLPQLAKGSKVVIEGDFALQPPGNQQADFYLGWDHGRETDEFLKLAILPKAVTLFHFRDGRWRTLSWVSYEAPLEVSDGRNLKWHTATVSFDNKTRKLRLDLETKRWAEFELKEHIPIDRTAIGVGTWGGVAYFRNVKIR